MDELSAVFDDKKSKRRSKRMSCLSFGMSSDSGIGMSWHSMNHSIADSVKLRKRRKRAVNSKQFDSKYFFDSVVDRMEQKYKNHPKDDPIIDLQNMSIVGKKGFLRRRVRTPIGYFAENTLEDLRQNSFRDKDLITRPLMESTPKKAIQRSINTSIKNVLKRCQQNSSKTSHSRAVPNKQSVLKSNQLVTDSNDSNECEELDESHPLFRYESRKQWTDNDYQIDCLQKAMEMLENDRNGRFSRALITQAMKTLKLQALPTGADITPIIKFNLKGKPIFEFFFGSSQSPVDVTEVLQMDSQVMSLSQLVYDCICLQPNTGHKNLNK